MKVNFLGGGLYCGMNEERGEIYLGHKFRGLSLSSLGSVSSEPVCAGVTGASLSGLCVLVLLVHLGAVCASVTGVSQGFPAEVSTFLCPPARDLIRTCG